MLYNNSKKKPKSQINNIKHSITTAWALSEINRDIKKSITGGDYDLIRVCSELVTEGKAWLRVSYEVAKS